MANKKVNDPAAKFVVAGAALVLLATVFFLVTNLSNTIEKNSLHKEVQTNQTSEADTKEVSMMMASANANIQPIGSADGSAQPVVQAALSGKEIYDSTCAACHSSGVMSAPKLDKAAWDNRLSDGFEAVLKNAINGKGGMPPKGGNSSLSDDDMQAVVTYMLEESGITEGLPAPKTAPAATTVAETPSTSNSIDGKALYDTSCAACHASGAAGAPVTGENAQWTDRIAAGNESLYSNAINGKGGMPPKGGSSLSDDEIKAVVDFMVSSSSDAPVATEETPKTAETPTSSSIDGKALYDASCAACHASGAAGAPVTGENAQWTDRIAAGKDSLYANAINGKGGMPPKGGSSLSDDEIKAVVDFMVSNSK